MPDKSYYSVPYWYIGKNTLIHYTKGTVEVHYNNQRIALYHRNGGKGSYTTKREHLSSTHKFRSDWTRSNFKKMAARHGKHVRACTEDILDTMVKPDKNPGNL